MSRRSGGEHESPLCPRPLDTLGLPLALLSVLVLAACGGGSSTGPSSPLATPTSQPRVFAENYSLTVTMSAVCADAGQQFEWPMVITRGIGIKAVLPNGNTAVTLNLSEWDVGTQATGQAIFATGALWGVGRFEGTYTTTPSGYSEISALLELDAETDAGTCGAADHKLSLRVR